MLRKILPYVIAVFAVAGLVLPHSARAGTTYDTALASPGTYYGHGNANSHWTVGTGGGIELGLSTVLRYVSPVTPGANTGTYDVGTGDTAVAGKTGSLWGYAFSVNTDPGGVNSAYNVQDLTLLLTITDVGTGQSISYNPSLVPDNNMVNGGVIGGGSSSTYHLNSTTTGIQNAEAMNYSGVAPPDYNALVNDTYDFSLTAYNDGTLLDSVNMTVVAGSGAPAPVSEPWSVAVFGIGVLGLIAAKKFHRRSGGSAA